MNKTSMHRWAILLLGLAAAWCARETGAGTVTSVFQKGVSPGVTYTQCLDSTLRSLTGYTFGMQSLGRAPAMDPRWPDSEGTELLRFDVSSIPSYANVSSATLRIRFEPDEFETTSGYLVICRLGDPDGTGLWQENTNATPADYGIADPTNAFGCAAYKRPNVAWTAAGGDVLNVTGKVVRAWHAAGTTEWIELDVATAVQFFVQTPASNLGWLVQAETDDTLRGDLFTSDAADPAKRPQLRVVYGLPDSLPPTADAGTNQVLTDTDTNGWEWATLDGSASSDLDGWIASYHWSTGGVLLVTGVTAQVLLPLGTNEVTLTVTDDDALADTDTVQIVVRPAPTNEPPVLSPIGDRTAWVEHELRFTVSATDPDDDSLDYTASNLPPGAVFAAQQFVWTPATGQTGLFAGVLFHVSDGRGGEDAESVGITVREPSGRAVVDEWGRTLPPLADILAGCMLLAPGDIPDFSFPPPTNEVFVATPADGGNDANDGRTLATPFEHLETAVEYVNARPGTPFAVYIRRGVHTYKRDAAYDYLEITRGNLLVSAWQDEEVVIRPRYWPGNPTNWGDAHAIVAGGPFDRLGFENLTFEGWGTVFYLGSSLATPPMSNIWMRGITARDFKYRDANPNFLRTFFETGILLDDVYGAGKNIATNFPEAQYQIENLVIAQCRVRDAEMAVNIGDENDANVKGLRISEVVFRNPAGSAGESSANDGFAVVNSYKVLIDHCTIENIQDEGIDTKSEDVSVVNCFVRGTGRNAVKFWLSGELINTIIYDATPIDDGAIIFESGPGRMVNCLLMEKQPGYAGTMNYGNPHGVDGYRFEIINSIFADLANPFYYLTTNVSIRNNLFDEQQTELFEHGSGSIQDVAQLNIAAGCSNNVAGLPGLLSPASSNFVPGYAFAGLDAGTTNGVVLPAFDFYGRPRVIGAAPDIGPIEYDETWVDSDGDGHVDGDELTAGTDPTNSTSILTVEAIRAGPETVLRWWGASGREYDVLFAPAVTGVWAEALGGTNLAGSGSALGFTNQFPDPRRFFRLRVRLP
ncbi:MAG: DNRLRE domain-containing protein [Verrucomicrobia bacterium]|nr:DNRLRE domain-containing protein [Verrucomicrobiota bacterium]